MPNLQDWHESIELIKSAANTRAGFRRRPEKNIDSSQPIQIALRPADSEPRRGRGPRKNETREELLERLLDPMLTLDETARVLEVCPTTVRRYTNRGILQHERSKGNQRRFKLSSVLAFMALQSCDLPKVEE